LSYRKKLWLVVQEREKALSMLFLENVVGLRRRLRKKLKNGTKHTKAVMKTLMPEERDSWHEKVRGRSDKEFLQRKNSANNLTARKPINIKFK
jgi:hypothetical protein